MTLGYREGVSIAVLVFYIPALAIAILLSIRHGLKKASGWRFMIIFTLARVLESCLDLATISQPDNASLYIGYATLSNVALSPLILVSFGLLSRVISSINRSLKTTITPRHVRLAELLVTVGLILSIIGGVDAGNQYGKTGTYRPQTLSQVGLGLMIAAFALLILTTLTLSKSIQHAERSERRILLAVVASLPFLLVRTVYSGLAVFANKRRFRLLGGDVTTLLCMALLQEIVVVVLYEGVGLTLKKETKDSAPERGAGGEEAVAGGESELKPVDKEQKGWLSRLWPVVNLAAT